MPRLTTVVGSMKPAPGSALPSACRELNGRCVAALRRTFPFVEVLDIREARLPPYEGHAPQTHPDTAVRAARETLGGSDAVAWVAPAYLGTLGGALKSFVEVTVGSPYASPERWSSPLQGTPAVGFVVGDCAASAEGGARDLTDVLAHVGSPLAAPVVTLADPTDASAAEAAAQRYLAALAELALRAVSGRPAG